MPRGYIGGRQMQQWVAQHSTTFKRLAVAIFLGVVGGAISLGLLFTMAGS